MLDMAALHEAVEDRGAAFARDEPGSEAHEGGMDVVRTAFEALSSGGLLVCTPVLVDRAAAAWTLLGNSVQIAASRAVPIADGFRLDAENPVFVSWGTR